MRQIISSTADGICTIDPQGVVTLVNPAAAEMLGRDDLLGADLHAAVHPGAGRENLFAAVMESRTAEPLVSDTFVRLNGLPFEVEVSCSPIVGENKVLGAVVAFRDVTRRNALERELDRTTRLSSLGQLAATIAHEFNNVMMGIMPFMEVIIRRADSDDSLRMMATHVNQALSRAKQITLGILKFARNPEPDLLPTTLATLIESSLPEVRAIAGQVGVRVDNHRCRPGHPRRPRPVPAGAQQPRLQCP
jgi:PAS domain S-box